MPVVLDLGQDPTKQVFTVIRILHWPVGYALARIDFTQHQVTTAGKEVVLTAIEYRLLAYLAQNAGRVVTQDMLLERV